MHTAAYYFKLAFIVILTFFQSYFLSWFIFDYVKQGDYFSWNTTFALTIVGLMLLLSWTFALSVGAWHEGLQYLITPVPTAVAIFAVLLPINLTYAIYVAIGTVLMLAYDIWKSDKLSDLLVRFEPTIILKFSTNGMLFLFCLLAGVFVLIYNANAPEMNIGKQLSDLVGDPLEAAIQNQIQGAIQGTPTNYLTNLDPSITGVLQQLGLPTNLADPAYANPQNLGIDAKAIVENQVNSFIEPYKNFVKPVMAILLFAIFQFYAFIARIFFMMSVNIVFWIAKKTGFLQTEIIQVNKEILKF